MLDSRFVSEYPTVYVNSNLQQRYCMEALGFRITNINQLQPTPCQTWTLSEVCYPSTPPIR